MKNKKIPLLIAIPLLILIGAITYFAYNYYLQNRFTEITPEDVQSQLNYSEDTKKQLEKKPFLSKLPYSTINFDIFYSSINDEIQVVMKDTDKSYDEAKKANEEEVNNLLKSFGVNLSTQKIVWLLKAE